MLSNTILVAIEASDVTDLVEVVTYYPGNWITPAKAYVGRAARTNAAKYAKRQIAALPGAELTDMAVLNAVKAEDMGR